MLTISNVSAIIATRDAPPEGSSQDAVRESPVEAEEDVDSYIKNAPLLYQLIVESSWEAVVERCKSHPEESRRWIVRKDEKSWRRLPLHEACIRGASAEVIDALLEANRDASKAPDHSSRLPLHHACFYGCSADVVRKLLCANSDGALKKDAYDKLPIKIAQSSSSHNRGEIVNLLSKDPVQVMLEEYRCKWEKEREPVVLKIRAEFEAERAKYEAKIQAFSEAIKDQWHKYEKEVKLMKHTNHLEFLNKEHRTEKKKIIEENQLSLEKQRNRYEERLAALEKEEEETMSRLKKAENEVTLLTESLNIATKSEQQVKDKVELLENKIQDQTLRYNELSQINVELHLDLAKSNTEALSVMNQLSSSVEREDAMVADINRLKSELAAEKLTIKKLNLMIDTCRAENQSLMEQLNAHQEGVTTMQVKADFYIDKNKADASAFETLKNISDENASLTAHTEELKQLVAAKDAELMLAAENLGDVLKRNETMGAEFQKQLQNAKESNQKLVEAHEKEKHQLIIKVINLTTQLEDLKASTVEACQKI